MDLTRFGDFELELSPEKPFFLWIDERRPFVVFTKPGAVHRSHLFLSVTNHISSELTSYSVGRFTWDRSS